VTVQTANPDARNSDATAMSHRRLTASAHAPDGISRTRPATDHSTNSEAIWAAERPATRNATVYSAKNRTPSSVARSAYRLRRT
jgi:hypothetical protein